MSTITITIITAIVTSAATLILQKSFTNVISGIEFLIHRPFKKGDKIRIRNAVGEFASGTVKRIGLTRTSITTYDGDICFLANSLIDSCVIDNAVMQREANRPEHIRITLDSNITRALAIIEQSLVQSQETLNTKENTDIVCRYYDGGVSLQYNVRSCNIDRSFSVCSDICVQLIAAFNEAEDITLR